MKKRWRVYDPPLPKGCVKNLGKVWSISIVLENKVVLNFDFRPRPPPKWGGGSGCQKMTIFLTISNHFWNKKKSAKSQIFWTPPSTKGGRGEGGHGAKTIFDLTNFLAISNHFWKKIFFASKFFIR